MGKIPPNKKQENKLTWLGVTGQCSMPQKNQEDSMDGLPNFYILSSMKTTCQSNMSRTKASCTTKHGCKPDIQNQNLRILRWKLRLLRLKLPALASYKYLTKPGINEGLAWSLLPLWSWKTSVWVQSENPVNVWLRNLQGMRTVSYGCRTYVSPNLFANMLYLSQKARLGAGLSKCNTSCSIFVSHNSKEKMSDLTHPCPLPTWCNSSVIPPERRPSSTPIFTWKSGGLEL